MVDDGDREFARTRAALAADTFAGIDVLRETASGGMGRVFEGVELATGRRVAVKLLAGGPRTDPTRFAAEAEILESLRDDSVVAYVAHGVLVGGEPYLVMEWLEGETLAERLRREDGALPVADAVAVARRVASALECAHEKGVVHRDVKPSNVFLPAGAPAEAKLIDFGIARQLEVDRQLTATGQVVGTPGYMAPEQALGRRDLDGRADLFALGCLLYEAVYGQAPFPGEEVVEILAKVLMHDPQPVSSGRPAPPRRLASLIQALLAKEPEDRLASASLVAAELAEIARALEHHDSAALRREPYRRARVRRPRRALVSLGAALAVAVGAGALSTDWPADAPAELCGGAGEAFATAWSPPRRAALRAGLVASGAPGAAATADRLAAVLDDYGARWVEAHRDACRATRIRGEQTEELLGKRMSCLERRRQAVVALVELMARADATTATRAGAAAAGLPEVADCAELASLEQVVPLPAEPARRARLEALAAELAQARVRYQTGAFQVALTQATALAEAARELGYRPFEAEAELLQGQLEHRLGKAEAAIKTLEAAVWAAEAGRLDVVAARGWVDLLFIVGYERGDHARAKEHEQRASAAIARLGGHPDLEANLEQGLGAIAATQGKLGESISHFEKAIPLLEQVFGAGHPNVAGARENLALALLQRGDAAAAASVMKQVLAMRERALDAKHPLIGRALQGLGAAHVDAGEPALAEAELRRALGIADAGLGEAHPETIELRTHLSRALHRLGRVDEAVELARKAVALAETTFGPDDVALASPLAVLGAQLTDAGQLRDAEQVLARAEQIFAARPSARVERAGVWAARGDLERRRARWPEAIAQYERALEVLERAEGGGQARTRAWIGLGEAYLATRRPKLAVAPLERAKGGPLAWLDAPSVGALDFALARALWDSGGDRARARALASQARDELEPAGPRAVARVDAWLARHR
ncbi:MAG: tetratricopeptide repeat protein [Kofleriaceae bacterium]